MLVSADYKGVVGGRGVMEVRIVKDLEERGDKLRWEERKETRLKVESPDRVGISGRESLRTSDSRLRVNPREEESNAPRNSPAKSGQAPTPGPGPRDVPPQSRGRRGSRGRRPAHWKVEEEEVNS